MTRRVAAALLVLTLAVLVAAVVPLALGAIAHERDSFIQDTARTAASIAGIAEGPLGDHEPNDPSMAAALNVSSAYLSALEHGRRGKPTWILLQRIIHYFNVIWDEAEELQRLAELSDPKVTIDTGGMSPEATELANRLARDISRLAPEDLAFLRTELIRRVK